jgi:pyruvate kinase
MPVNDAAPSRTRRPAQDLELARLRRELVALREEILKLEARFEPQLKRMPPSTEASARNLVHYLAMRRRDLRGLQESLARQGLSSLGRAESHVLESIEAVLAMLTRRARRPAARTGARARTDFTIGAALLRRNAETLLGPAAGARGVRIMVTLPAEAAEDYTLVARLLESGMDCARINCAHDRAEDWGRMVAHIRRASQSLGRECRILMDLAGPKLRTGPVEPAPAVIKIRPARDELGRVVRGARVWLTAADSPRPAPSFADAELPVPHELLVELREGDWLELRDAREAARRLEIVDATERGAWASCVRTAYLVPGLPLKLKRATGVGPEASLGAFTPREGAIDLHAGDVLVLRGDSRPGRPARRDASGEVLTPAFIGCTMPEIFADVRSGEPIWFDDGKIGGVIERVRSDELLVRITRARPRGARLRADKGINLPESLLRVPALTSKDLEDLEFIAANADVVALSFANRAEDVHALQRELARRGPRRPAIVLKIETQRGFRALPEMLLAALRSGACGVMIARGDLAVECGFERLAEVQEEILWLCEAAHVPVIWATQVLEGLAKEGMPSRAEITDAAMGNRAECVMLNKGPHVIDAVRVLAGILVRMQGHQQKKRSMLRALRLAQFEP